MVNYQTGKVHLGANVSNRKKRVNTIKIVEKWLKEVEKLEIEEYVLIRFLGYADTYFVVGYQRWY